MPLESLLSVYVLAGLSVLALLAWWDGRQRREFETGRTDDRIFRCDRCGFVYTDDPEVEESRCPVCTMFVPGFTSRRGFFQRIPSSEVA